MRKLLTSLSVVLSACLLTANLQAQDWPRWRGPQDDGIVREKGLARQWPDGGPKKLWSKDIGQGYSSPVAKDDRIYMFSTVNSKDTLTCFKADTGEVLWAQSYDSGYAPKQYPGTRGSPTIDGDSIYTYGGKGDLACWNLADGKVKWRLNVLSETKSQNIAWGVASTPLVRGEIVCVQSGKGPVAAIAVDKNSGKVQWKAPAAAGGSYAAPVMIDVDGKPQIVVFATEGPIGLNPADGKVLWTSPWKTQYDVHAAMPIYKDGLLFISSNYGTGCAMFKVSADKVEQQWQNKEMQNRFQPSILDAGHLYGNSEGQLKCLSWPDGKVKWTEGKLGLGAGGSVVRFEEFLVIQTERGKMILAKATPEGFTKISEFENFPGGKEIWSTPLIFKGKMYCKGTKEFVCYDISETK